MTKYELFLMFKILKIILAKKGEKLSEETRQKISQSKKGQVAWNKGRTGIYSEETKKKMSVSQFKKGMTPHNKGKKATEDEKKKMSKAMNRPEVKKKLSESFVLGFFNSATNQITSAPLLSILMIYEIFLKPIRAK
ncbi:MAG: hypothetical protein DBX08_02040 [Nitrosopumilus sp.]|nr:MAG: hypothetical protein DBX08_02040 [Nitrosopumilus sp.]